MKYRSHVNKHKSSRKFRGQVSHVKSANMRNVGRGGIRF